MEIYCHIVIAAVNKGKEYSRSCHSYSCRFYQVACLLICCVKNETIEAEFK